MSLLDATQQTFAHKVAVATGLRVEAVAAWCLGEEPAGGTRGYNCLNCLSESLGRSHGFSGVPIAGYSPAGFAEFENVTDAATEASWWINHMSNYVGIRAAVKGSAVQQVDAIAKSPWDAGHYGGSGIANRLRSTLAQVTAEGDLGGAEKHPFLVVTVSNGGRELGRVKLGKGAGRKWISDHRYQLIDTAVKEGGVVLSVREL